MLSMISAALSVGAAAGFGVMAAPPSARVTFCALPSLQAAAAPPAIAVTAARFRKPRRVEISFTMLSMESVLGLSVICRSMVTVIRPIGAIVFRFTQPTIHRLEQLSGGLRNLSLNTFIEPWWKSLQIP